MLRLYNTRTRSVEDFAALREGKVRMYVCGLTPSAEPHLGHARSFLFFDVFRRYLRHLGYDVVYVQNVTDIDDRAIEAARDEGRPWNDVVERYYRSFKESMRRLGVAEPDVEPRATEYVPQILAMIERLVERGNAYVTDDGIYFRVATFPAYGKLSGKQIDELMVGARIAENEKKLDPLDFALWKFEKPGEPSWPSKWGPGRPGWHIECSAMAHELLGEPFDVHGGGADLIFPHHENEIAQSESLLPDVPMANFWVHGGLLNFEQRKMSKSWGNYEPLYELLDRLDETGSIPAARLLFLQSGYRKPVNFSEASLEAARLRLARLRSAYAMLKDPRAPGPAEAVSETKAAAVRKGLELVRTVEAALDDDLNTAVALAHVDEVLSAASSIVLSPQAGEVLGQVDRALQLLGLDLSPGKRPRIDVDAVAARLRERLDGTVGFDGASGERIIEAVIAARNEARKKKDFALADRLREALAEERIHVHDTRDGTTWTLAGD
jgi:cysteinyl-tRNA synthetase